VYWVRIILTLTVFSAVLGFGHYYLWHRLLHAPDLDRKYRRLGAALLATLAVSLPITFVLIRNLPREQTSTFAFVAFAWLGLASTWVTLFAVTDLVRGAVLLARRNRKGSDADPERRKFFQRVAAGSVALTGTGLAGASAVEALSRVTVKRVEIFLERLTPEFDGFRIAQISDIHIGPTLGREFLQGIVDRVNDLRPNLVAITGDLVDGSVVNLGRHTEPLQSLRASDGVYFVTGNHEYYSGADEWVSELERLGIPTLRNRRVSLQRGETFLDIAGVTDHRADSFGDGPDFDAALGGRDGSREVVLLAHQPAAAAQATQYGVGLQLSGHTHGGQFWPWTWIIYLIQPVVRGLGRVGQTQVYVNTGTGYWGPPMRFQTPPEITEIVLRART
jgi:uncharacterized protein